LFESSVLVFVELSVQVVVLVLPESSVFVLVELSVKAEVLVLVLVTVVPSPSSASVLLKI
jgi:hypothetical protein